MASLLSSLVRGVNVDDENKPTTSSGPTPPVDPSKPTGPAGAMPVPTPAPAPAPAPAAMPVPSPATPPAPGLPTFGNLNLEKSILQGVKTALGTPQTPEVNPKQFDDLMSNKFFAQDTKDIATFTQKANNRRPMMGNEFLDSLKGWFDSSGGTYDVEVDKTQSPMKWAVQQILKLKDSPDPNAQKKAAACGDAMAWLTAAVNKNDPTETTKAQKYLKELFILPASQYSLPVIARKVNQTQGQIKTVVKPDVVTSGLMDIETDPETIKRNLITRAVFSYVHDAFKGMKTDVELGNDNADTSRKSLSIFGDTYKDITAPVTEGTEEARLDAFAKTPQGRSFIQEAYSDLRGLGFFRTDKFKDLVKRETERVKAAQTGKEYSSPVTIDEIKNVFGPTQMGRVIRTSLAVHPSLDDESIKAYGLSPDDETVRGRVYKGMSPNNIMALHGQGDNGALIGRVDMAGQPNAPTYDISSNIRESETKQGVTIRDTGSSRIKTRPELAGSIAAGLGLSETLLRSAANKMFTDPKDIQAFVDAGLSDYNVHEDVVPKIESDVKALRMQKTGGLTTSGSSQTTSKLLDDAYSAIGSVMPYEKQEEWRDRKRVLSNVTVQARNLEGTNLQNAGRLFAITADNKPDFNVPQLPSRDDHVGRIQLLQAMLQEASTNAAYRTNLQRLMKSAASLGTDNPAPYTGSIKMTPQELSSLIGLYASRLESASMADSTGMTDEWYQKTFGILPSELSKKDLKFDIVRSLMNATPSRFRTLSRSLYVQDDGETRFIPTTDAGRVMENASEIPGDTGGKSGRRSPTELAALRNVAPLIADSKAIMGRAISDAKQAVYAFVNSPYDSKNPESNKSFKDGVVSVMKKSLLQSLDGVRMSEADKQKFLQAVNQVADQLGDVSITEWTRGTVTSDEIDDLFKPYETGLSISSATRTPVKSKPSITDLTNAATEVGTQALDSVMKTLGMSPKESEAFKARMTGDVELNLKQHPEYAGFLQQYADKHYRTLGVLNQALISEQKKAESLRAIISNESSTPEQIEKSKEEIQFVDAEIKRIEDQAKITLSQLDEHPSYADWQAFQDEQNRQVKALRSAESEKTNRYTRLRQKLLRVGFNGLTSSEQKELYDEDIKRYQQGLGNTVARGNPRRLAFLSFATSPQGQNWRLDEPHDKAGNIIQQPLKLLDEIKDDDGNTIGHKLSENVKFNYVWKRNQKTGRYTELQIVAEQRVPTADGVGRVVAKQKIETGGALEQKILSAYNAKQDAEKQIDRLSDTSSGGNANAKFGQLTNANGTTRRAATSMGGLVRDIVTLANTPNRNAEQNASLASMIEAYEENAKLPSGINVELSDSDIAAGKTVVRKYLENLITIDANFKDSQSFVGKLRDQVKGRIESFAGNREGRNARTPAEIEADITDWFEKQKNGTDPELITKQQGIVGKFKLSSNTGIFNAVHDIVQAIDPVSDTSESKKVSLSDSDRFTLAKTPILKMAQDQLARIDDALTKTHDANAVSTYATDRIKLTKLIKSLEAAKTFVDTEKIINDNVSKLPALTNRLSAALKTSQSGENTFRGIVQKFLEYSNKPQNELSDYDKKAMLIYRNAINAVFAKDGKDITSDANPAKLLMQAHLYQEKLKRQQADAAAASDIKFGVSFGEQARHYVRMDIPGLFGQAGDEKHYQKWKAKLRKADRERLEGYQELGNQLGFDTKRYTLSYNVWHDLEKTWRSKSPEQWINWIYGTDMDPGLRNKILTEYPLGSSELGVHKPNGPRGPYSFEISEPRMELGINKDGYVVPINTRKKPDTTPEWVYNNRNPEDKRGLESLMWRIKNGSTTYYDTLVWDKNVERTYNITVDGNQQTLKNIDKYLTSTGALKDGVKINGWIETRTNAEGKKYKTNHSGDTYEKSDIHPWQLSETIIKNNKGWGIPADPAKIKQAIAPPYEGYGKPKNAEFPLRHGDRLGFTYEGKTFWVGRPAYRRLVEDINAGKIDKTNLKAVVAQLLPSFRIETGRQGTNIAAKREGEGHLLSIPDDVQTRIIKEADKAGWKGVTKSNAKKGTIGFLLALVALIRDKTISKLQEE